MSKYVVDGCREYSLFQDVYNIPVGAPISLQHVLSVLLYTNHTELSAAFSRSYRKLRDSESDYSLKHRHSFYANWAKLLCETMEAYGVAFADSSLKRFYHGISSQMLFDELHQYFRAPTSTTLQYEVALNFANDEGIIITIKNDRVRTMSYFNCIPWSDFGAEYEMLFVAGYSPLEICGLSSIAENTNYSKWIQSMSIFQNVMISGHLLSKPISEEDVKRIKALVHYRLYFSSRKAKSKQNSLKSRTQKAEIDIPPYIRRLFDNMLNKARTLMINTKYVNDDVNEFAMNNKQCRKYGYRKLKDLCFSETNEFKWNHISLLFPSIRSINIIALHIHENQNIMYPSIAITNQFMQKALKYLANTKRKFNSIMVNHPQNKRQDLNVMIKRYSASFRKIKCKLVLIKSTDVDHDRLIIFKK